VSPRTPSSADNRQGQETSPSEDHEEGESQTAESRRHEQQLSPMDACFKARNAIFFITSTETAPWTVIGHYLAVWVE
jgi:hypothetical protein